MKKHDDGTEDLNEAMAAVFDALVDIPVVGTAISLGRAGEKIRDHIYYRKVSKILSETSSVSNEDRQAFLSRLERDGERDRFAEAVILMIDRIDEMQKAPIIGRIMASLMKGDIARAMALRLCAAVNKAYYDDLLYLRVFAGGAQGENETAADGLFAAGLVVNRGSDGGTLDGRNKGGTIYEMSEFGCLLRRYIG